MIRPLSFEEEHDLNFEFASWLTPHIKDFHNRFSSLLSVQFRSIPTTLAFKIIRSTSQFIPKIGTWFTF